MRATIPPSTRSMPTDTLRRIEAKLDALLKEKKASAAAEKLCVMAKAKFDAGLPMRTAEVAVVLGLKPASVLQAVFNGKLKQKYGGGRFDAADVRAFLEASK